MTIDGGPPQLRWRRSAAFVDFDNVYSGLQRLDRAAAEIFATDPSIWLTALGSGTDHDGPFRRRFLICNCYLNPSTHSRFRPFWTRAGFRVIDCPSLTQQGKSSADINLVLDVIDAMSNPTRYDEFLLLSADADFTPLALRLRAQDRRVTVVLAGPGASAYKSVADTVVEPDEFAQQLAPSVDGGVEERIGEGALPATDEAGDDYGVKADDGAARNAVVTLLETSEGPLLGPRVAQAAIAASPSLRETHWLGHRTFAAWLASRVPIAGQVAKGSWHFVWDSQRFTESDVPRNAPISAQVADVTDTPALSQEQYATLISSLADDVNAHAFDRTQTSKRVRDACHAAGAPIGRNSVNFVIQGLVFAGVDVAAPVQREDLASAWADNVLGLCRVARMELDDAAESEIRRWVSGGLAPEV